jgi:pteridine reductase
VTSHITGQITDRRLQGKIALVTGSSRRIGRAIAIALAEEGVNVVAHDRRALESDVVKVCDEVVGCGAKSWKIVADLEKEEEYSSLIARSIQTAGSLDILINNASLFLPNTIMDVEFKDITQHLQVNAWTPFVLSRQFAKLAIRGKIINLLDTKITAYERTHVAYILSKQMLATMTKMCALEFAPAITVNGIAPGLILPPAGKDNDYLERLAKTVPLWRHGGPRDIIDGVIYLLKSDFITGQIIYVDGGRHLLESSNGSHFNQ